MLAVKSLVYSPHKTLVKVNLATMSASLQTRAFFFEERIIEFAWRLPARLKIQVKKIDFAATVASLRSSCLRWEIQSGFRRSCRVLVKGAPARGG